jgi:aminoglycoside phosphotransferase (APT) family kinase protein
MRAADYAAEAAVPGTEARRRVAAGLEIYGLRDVARMLNPTSGRKDGVTPSRTAMIIAEDARGERLCVKLYDGSAQATEFLSMHLECLATLRGVIPVPEVAGVEWTMDTFGRRALVTSYLGEPFDHAIPRLSSTACSQVAEQLADALVAVSQFDLSASQLRLPINDELRHALLERFGRDSAWCAEHAPAGPESLRSLVLRGAELLASADLRINGATLCHTDLVAGNILIQDEALSGIVDWDYAEVGPSELDLGMSILGFLVTLPTARSKRLRLLEIVLERYAHRLGQPGSGEKQAALLFALDALLDWTIDGKNAPLDDFMWVLSGVVRAIEEDVPLGQAFRQTA